MIVAGGRYLAYGTQTGTTNVQVMDSPDLAAWRPLGDALPELPAWAGRGHTWSPAVLERSGGYVLYYAVRHAASGLQCLSVATSPTAAGPFVDTSTGPFLLQADRGGSIDPSPVVDGDGSAYLLWKSDDNAIRRRTSLWGAPLSDNGLALAGAPVELLRQDQAWEHPVIEAPSLARSAGSYFLFYSGGWWESDRYGVGCAAGPSPLGPFRKRTTTGPWLGSAPGMAGPGGAEAFTALDGRPHLAFHAWTPPRVGYAAGGVRSLWIAPLVFGDTGPLPVVF